MTGHEIKNIRTKLGMSQPEFAEKLFVSSRTVSRWENNDAKPTRLAIKQIERLQLQNLGKLLEDYE